MKIDLTPRQEEVFYLILKGMNNKQIGEKLGISYFTAKCIAGAVMKKLECHSKNEIMFKFKDKLKTRKSR
jgi:DNA-binding NarL/FixJ family response regulator